MNCVMTKTYAMFCLGRLCRARRPAHFWCRHVFLKSWNDAQFFGKKGRASFHHHHHHHDDDDEMTPSKSWAKTAAALKLFTHWTFYSQLTCSLCWWKLYSRTPDERPPSPTTIPLIRPHFVWRTVVSVRIRIPHERPSLLYDHTNVILRVVV